MKRISNSSNRFAFGSIAFATAALVAAPIGGLAFTSNAVLAAAIMPRTSTFCTTLTSKASTTEAALTQRTTQANDVWGDHDAKLTANFTRVDQAVAAARAKADEERASDFTKLESKATTDAQKQAVQTYEATVRNAVTTRRAAYDAARDTFRTGVQHAIATHNGGLTDQLSTLSASVTAAFNTAETTCANDTGNGTPIRTALQARLKTAREVFQTGRKTTVGSQVKTLAQTRSDAFKAADQAFHASMTAARQALQQALGSTAA